MNDHPNAAVVRSAYEAMAKGDVAGFADLLHDDITWHESTVGFEGDYQGRDQVLGLLGRVFEETGVQMSDLSIHDVLANDEHTVILHETTMTKDGRSHTGQFVDVYHVRDGKLSEHWHLVVDPKADDEFFSG